MPRKRKTPSREELRRLERRRRVAEAWMAGATASAIAKSERVSVHTVYGDLSAASDVVLPAGTKEQLLARNFARLESVISANRDGVEKGDDTATRNAVKALAEQNRMLGVSNGAVNNFTINVKQGDGGIKWEFDRTLKFVKGREHHAEDDSPPEPPREYAYPRLLEYKPDELAPFAPDAPSDPPPEPPRKPPPPRTEFDLPVNRRFGFDATEESRVFKTVRRRR